MTATATRYELVHFDRPWTANKERTLHFHQRADLVALWRQTFMALAADARIGRLDRIAVTAMPLYRGNAHRPDVAACYPAVKAAIDGLTDARVIPDDGPDHLISLTFLPAVMGAARDALVLEIERIDE